MAGRRSLPGPTKVDIHVGERVTQLRLWQGLTQKQLGDRLGLTFQQVQKYERGVNRIVASRLLTLATIFDVPIGFFFDGLPGVTPSASPLEHKKPNAETLRVVEAYYRLSRRKRRAVIEFVKRITAEERA
jgi:transcriptional regulator with XRE-family HTH domain